MEGHGNLQDGGRVAFVRGQLRFAHLLHVGHAQADIDARGADGRPQPKPAARGKVREVRAEAHRVAREVARIEEEDDAGELREDEAKLEGLLPQREPAERANAAFGWIRHGAVGVRGNEEAERAVRTDLALVVAAVRRRPPRIEAAKEEELLVAHDPRVVRGHAGRARAVSRRSSRGRARPCTGSETRSRTSRDTRASWTRRASRRGALRAGDEGRRRRQR